MVSHITYAFFKSSLLLFLFCFFISFDRTGKALSLIWFSLFDGDISFGCNEKLLLQFFNHFFLYLKSVSGISPPDFDNQTLAVLRGRLVRYLMRSREVSVRLYIFHFFFDSLFSSFSSSSSSSSAFATVNSSYS